MLERCPKCGAKVWFTNDVCPHCREFCPARPPATPPEAEKDAPKTKTPVSRNPEERRRLMERAVGGALVLMAAGIISLPLGMSTFWMDRQAPFHLPLLVVGGGICASPVVLLRLCAGWRVRDLAAVILACVYMPFLPFVGGLLFVLAG